MWSPGPLKIGEAWHHDGHANEWTVYNGNDWPMCNLVNDDGSRARFIAAAPLLLAFHDAWVESQVASAKGSPDIYKEKRAALIARHKAVSAALNGLERQEPKYLVRGDAEKE